MVKPRLMLRVRHTPHGYQASARSGKTHGANFSLDSRYSSRRAHSRKFCLKGFWCHWRALRSCRKNFARDRGAGLNYTILARREAEPPLSKGKFMPLTMFAALALLLATTFHAQPRPTARNRLVRAAFFSDACRQEGEALGIARSSDAQALSAAFAGLRRQRASASGADAV